MNKRFFYGAAWVASFCVVGGIFLMCISSALALTTLISAQVDQNAPPAQVIINAVSATVVPSVSANVTITNEGIFGYEYDYEWCVVATIGNACGGGDDVFYSSAAKYIDVDEDWNTNLPATVPTPGTYFFKVVVYFGADSSQASQSFSITASGGGGGGGTPTPTVPITPIIPPTAVEEPPVDECNGADFNHDNLVNSVDFSILLAFWKTSPPFRNPCVDINKDNNVNSVDFSILLYEWTKR